MFATAPAAGVVLVLLLCSQLANSEDIDCADLKKVNVFGNLMYRFGSTKRIDFDVDFYVATRKHRNHTKIQMGEVSTLKDSGFDPTLKTILLLHGYKSGGTKTWVVQLKNKILDSVDVNVIMVDWRRGSYFSIYVDSARHTQVATNKIFNFLQGLRPRVEQLESDPDKILWNHLYFIGHSLGAQISGQTANLLKRDPFWKIERITGLDPAKPCFTDIDSAWRLDKNDADFVDIIHTQVGTGKRALGLGERIGHVDFYVNGGVMQPECHKSLTDRFTNDLDKEICSHKFSYKYFTNAVAESVNGGCSFLSYSWDGTYEDADRILQERINGSHCADCPQMGLDTPNSPKRGMFIVITSEAKPYCMKDERHLNFSKVAKVIGKLKGATSIFSRGE